ncbi:MAG: hypothetical protein KAR06_04485 [Deltaproteobacteria bacterium]|nr:hypothetical protein [Deltaproteobacteria bacterium]
MIRACDRCSMVREINFKPPFVVSHGPCLNCWPIMLRQSSMTEEEIETFMKELKEKEDQDENDRGD